MKTLILFFSFFTFSPLFAQVEDALVFLVDKENVGGALANPSTILTLEALERKNLQGTPIDERDVPITESYKTTIDAQPNVQVLAKSKWMNAVYVRGNREAISDLEQLEMVASIEFMNKSLNRDFSRKWNRDKFEIEYTERLNYNYGLAQNQIEMIAVDELHDENYDGQGISVAFLDNGYPGIPSIEAFSAMRSENRLLGYYDFVNRTESLEGSGSHGTMTLSTAAAYMPNSMIGTAPKASYYLYITEKDNEESPLEEALWVEALERADSLGVYVTNTSLGYHDFDNPAYNYTFEDLDGQTTIGARGANLAFEKGMLNVVSAGNEGGRFGHITSPADAPGAFTVGAVDFSGDYAGFSSPGPSYDGRVKPDVMAQGEWATVVDPYNNVTFTNGTSFSGPIIAGAVASLWQMAPHLKNSEIMQIIRESASLYHAPTDQMGYGIPDFGVAMESIKLLNIENHLQQQNFAVYPNPVESDLFIMFPKTNLDADLTLYDVLGKQIFSAHRAATDNKLDMSSLKSGLYILTITSNNKTNSFKIIKK